MGDLPLILGNAFHYTYTQKDVATVRNALHVFKEAMHFFSVCISSSDMSGNSFRSNVCVMLKYRIRHTSEFCVGMC